MRPPVSCHRYGGLCLSARANRLIFHVIIRRYNVRTFRQAKRDYFIGHYDRVEIQRMQPYVRRVRWYIVAAILQ